MCKIRFDINASDTDGNIVSGEGRYRLVGQTTWTVFVIPDINLPETPDITVEGDYELQVRVQDNDGAWNPSGFVSSPNFKIGNCTPNQLPVANAGVDRIIQLPVTSLTLDGSASNDPDGTISSFSWVVNAGVLSVSNTSNPTWSGLNNVGTYTATLTVTDNDGGVSSDTMTVTVQAATVYLNTQQSQAFTKNDCPNGSTGSTVTYVVPAGTYSSAIDQATANNLALNDINANGQAYANSQGTCTNVAPTTQYEIAIGDCSVGRPNTLTWTTVYSSTTEANLDVGTTLFTDAALTTPFQGNIFNSYRIRTSSLVVYNFSYAIPTTNGVINSKTDCSGGGNNGGSGSGNSLVIGSTVPITNGTGTLTFTGGEPNEVLDLDFNLSFYTSSPTINKHISFSSPVSVGTLNSGNTYQAGTVTLDSNGDATSNYTISEGELSCIVQITGRSSTEPIPTADSTTIDMPNLTAI